MDKKYKFITLNIIITIASIYFTYTVYHEYKESQQDKIKSYIEKSIQNNKKILINTFRKIKKEIENDKELFQKIHEEYTEKLRRNPSLNINNLKEEIFSKYNLANKEIHLFLLNKDYTITDSTYPPDIGFNLGLVADARLELDKTIDGKTYQSESVSIDLINSEIKSYSYSKINDSLFFEMGFINKKIHKILKNTMTKVQLITNKKSNLYRIEKKLNGDEYYDNILEKRVHKTKEEYLSSKKMFPQNVKTEDFVIFSNRKAKIIKKYNSDSLIIYIPLIKKSNRYLETMGDFVLELYIDRKYEIDINKKIDLYFYLFLFFHIFFLLIIYYFTKIYYESLIELDKKHHEYQQLLKENKGFISGIIDDIKAPLSVVMNNFSFIEKNIDNSLEKYTLQVNSAIDMLKSSYNDLFYIINDKKIQYPKEKIDLSSFLQERIGFFENIATSRNKVITSHIEENLYISINPVELERLIDNNISNGIKYGDKNQEISIFLKQEEKKAILEFHSSSEPIKDPQKIFMKNYQENQNSQKSLGLGLSMVSSICHKYNIEYKVDYKEKKNIFSYSFFILL